ncbi:isocyanide synthase family protein [Allokutzneria sp. A3M-2-11 16]|uniref:L-tyrosine/L-tryptophan isonitrile synthase family protein n=1 Tax=Allokutzneria sp. A3M-2-11 16 TaxID=2962043 RepID=UPI0020B83B03|nr:isocyanide synthase family protein [Allokutzneria sp. A3M-2-11 16]MCP3798440.1 isocyanide synthase family protein [Allokutzneria sp. A3M-2-11 16]
MTTPQDNAVARAILGRVLLHQRRSPIGRQCAEAPCPHCADTHLDRVARYVAAGRAVEFVLPAFPTKSPNPAKVLGVRPDLAEELALRFLSELCRDIAKIHEPGAKVVICSDGRVFGQLIRVSDASISTYQDGMRELVDKIDPRHLELFNLDDVCPSHSHDEMRSKIDVEYGESLEELRAEIKADDNALAMYRGIVRFLVEDQWNSAYEGTRSALQRECRARAYGVVGRSRSWGKLLAERFPDAVRLSIHPQPCASEKIGILLASADDVWLTPWHAVAVEQDGGFTLMKREHAEQAGARLVFVDGHPSHYVLSVTGPGRPPAPLRSPLAAR